MKTKMSAENSKMNTAIKHTPGPWHAAEDTYPVGDRNFIGIGNGAVHIGYASVTACVRLAEARTNARLIAAAPELLAACRAVFNDPYTTCACADRVRQAIAKAEGQ